eukprot:TRINITY_DN742_c4_g1_i1.p1 TRINITY_DN742_c4_g1~~TRINITY_DN742_c4_g1_i1.p1  ORF type:complete len:575 (+),score=169.69 TRINITY_DN742_c4_g1_i1:94-1818(+)
MAAPPPPVDFTFLDVPEGRSGEVEMLKKKKWGKIFCVLEAKEIKLYPDDTKKTELLVASLTEWQFKPTVEEKKASRKGFTLSSSDGKTQLVLAGATDEETAAWIAVISRASEYATPEVFGVPLRTAVFKGGNIPPLPVKFAIEYLESVDATGVSGIFRISPEESSQTTIKQALNSGNVPTFTDPHQATSVLKNYLRSLPDPLTTFERYHDFVKAMSHPNKAEMLAELINNLPVENRLTLQYILKYVAKVATRSAENLMNPKNLAVVMGPNVLRPLDATLLLQDTETINYACEVMITHYEEIFKDTEELAVEYEAYKNTPKATPRPKPALALPLPPRNSSAPLLRMPVTNGSSSPIALRTSSPARSPSPPLGSSPKREDSFKLSKEEKKQLEKEKKEKEKAEKEMKHQEKEKEKEERKKEKEERKKEKGKDKKDKDKDKDKSDKGVEVASPPSAAEKKFSPQIAAAAAAIAAAAANKRASGGAISPHPPSMPVAAFTPAPPPVHRFTRSDGSAPHTAAPTTMHSSPSLRPALPARPVSVILSGPAATTQLPPGFGHSLSPRLSPGRLSLRLPEES